MARDTLAGGGGRSTISLYHPRIRIHASRIKCGLYARKDSTTDTSLSVHLRRPPWSSALIAWTRAQELHWSLRRRASILVSIRLQVSGEIQECRWCSRQGGLGIALWSSENMRSALSGVAGGLIGKRVRFLG